MKKPSEDPVRLTESLKSLGLTKYEALVYTALLKVMNATASEIHESSGVPRASVYPVIDQLCAKGIVAVAQSVPKRFAAIPPGEAIALLLARVEQNAEYAIQHLSAIHRTRISAGDVGGELIWNVYGIGSIRSRLVDLTGGAKTDIRIFAHPQVFSDDVMKALTRAAARVTVEVVTSHWDGPSAENLKIWLKKNPDLPKELDKAKDMMAGGICIIDGSRVLVIVGTAEEDAVALFSESAGFVRFFVRYYSLIVDWAKKSG
jgi:HTH-type transcriptional regulator, sugar sensing transcriptional regulator